MNDRHSPGSAHHTPVIVGVGECTDRNRDPATAAEPLTLWASALQAASRDSGADLLGQLDSLALVGSVSWRYRDPAAQLCQQLGINPARAVNASMGGETPVRLVHEAALQIARGELTCAAIVGGEAMSSVNAARKARATLPWTPLADKADTPVVAGSRIDTSKIARALGIRSPTQMYPLYESAFSASRGQTPAAATRAAARLWAQYAQVAASNPGAWIQAAPDADTIAGVSAANRMICWPYRKLMVANPGVNQAAAVLVTSLAQARALGIAEERLIYIWGGASAAEPDNFLERDRFDHSPAQAACLDRAVAIAGGDARRFGKLELYSCFPVVPTMALAQLGLEAERHCPTVTGGLTFFGGPLNNYMSHALCAMVRELRAAPAELGLVYGQGGFVSKHHSLVLSHQPPAAPLDPEISVQAAADAARGPVPDLDEHYSGPARIETWTVLYGRDGAPLQGVVVLRTPANTRTMARVLAEDDASLALLTDPDSSAVGLDGHVRIDAFGLPAWSPQPYSAAARQYRYVTVTREAHLTLITINRPAQMNCLHPAANAELADAMDAFAADPEQWVAIITGAGERAFCSGNDLKYFARAMARGETVETPVTGYGGLTARFALDKPVIAAVNGAAMGGGFEIALACDLIIAADSASFALPEPQVGLAALAGGLLRLPRQIGHKAAMGMILTGRPVSAAEGMALGFVNEVVPGADLLACARRWAAQILACSPMSIRASKQIVREGLEAASLADAYTAQLHYPATRALFRSRDIREGPQAFAEKRTPQWRNEN